MSKFQLSAIAWSTLTGCAVLVSSLTNAVSAQQAGFEALPSFPGFAQTGTSKDGAAPTSTTPQAAMPQAQTAFAEQQLINSMTNTSAPAAQNSLALPTSSQARATMQPSEGATAGTMTGTMAGTMTGAMATGSDESLANATASMEDAHAAQMESTLTELEAAHAHAYNTLAAVLEKVPADARPAIQQAMEQSRQGYQKARDNRERVVAQKLNLQNARRGLQSVAGQRPNPQQGQQQGQQNQQGQQIQQGYAGQRPNPMARTVSGPSQPNVGTAQFNTAQGASSGVPQVSMQGSMQGATQRSMQGSTPGLIEGTTSVNPQTNPSVAQPGNRNYSTPEMNRSAPGRPMINGVNGSAQSNNFGVPASQRNPNYGATQSGTAAPGSNGQNVNGQNVNGQGMSRASTPDLNRYNHTKPNAGYNSQPGTATGTGTQPTGGNPGFGFNGSGNRQ